VVARPHACAPVAAIHHEFCDDGAGALARAVRSGRASRQPRGCALHRRACGAGLRHRRTAGQNRLSPPRCAHRKAFTAWPHFISTAPGVAYAYLDDYRRNRRDIYASARSLEELAARLGMHADALAQSISRYNETCGNRPKFGAGPYVVLGPVRAVFVHAECALAVDREHRVLGKDDKPIPGLFAAGSTGQGGLLLKGHGHHLAWAFALPRRQERGDDATLAPSFRGAA
jgi:hypothetical protein